MSRIQILMVATTLFGAVGPASAGVLGLARDLGGCAKSCGCASDCQPSCCKPTIARPCDVTVHTYQRKCSDIKPPCCNNSCCPSKSCCPTSCAKPTNCGKNCNSKGCDNNNCNAVASCAKPASCTKPVTWTKACGQCGSGYERKSITTCCKGDCWMSPRCQQIACEIAQLIYKSQTACYAKDRRNAIHKLGDGYDCATHPSIMAAFIYALNDADERVRAKAADKIGDQLRANPCCCSKITAALTCALADCDKSVRKEAEQALEQCGYEVVAGCCDDGCCDKCAHGAAPGATPAPYRRERLRRNRHHDPIRSVPKCCRSRVPSPPRRRSSIPNGTPDRSASPIVSRRSSGW